VNIEITASSYTPIGHCESGLRKDIANVEPARNDREDNVSQPQDNHKPGMHFLFTQSTQFFLLNTNYNLVIPLSSHSTFPIQAQFTQTAWLAFANWRAVAIPHALTTQSCALASTAAVWAHIHVAVPAAQPTAAAARVRHESYLMVSLN
jgi:hypothetical protein